MSEGVNGYHRILVSIAQEERLLKIIAGFPPLFDEQGKSSKIYTVPYFRSDWKIYDVALTSEEVLILTLSIPTTDLLYVTHLSELPRTCDL